MTLPRRYIPITCADCLVWSARQSSLPTAEREPLGAWSGHLFSWTVTQHMHQSHSWPSKAPWYVRVLFWLSDRASLAAYRSARPWAARLAASHGALTFDAPGVSSPRPPTRQGD